MSIEAMNWAYKQTIGNPNGKAILVALSNQADQDGKCWPSIPYIQARTEIGRRTIINHIALLEEKGYIAKRLRPGDGSGRKSNVYQLNLDRQIPTEADRQSAADAPCRQSAAGDRQSAADAPKQSLNNQSVVVATPRQEFMRIVAEHQATAECNEWLQVLKKKKVTMTKAAWERRLKVLEKLVAASENLPAIFLKSAESGWVGLFGDNNGKTRSTAGKPALRESRAERRTREANEHRAKVIGSTA